MLVIYIIKFPLLWLGQWIKKKWDQWTGHDDGRSLWERSLSEEAGHTGPLELVLSKMKLCVGFLRKFSSKFFIVNDSTFSQNQQN